MKCNKKSHISKVKSSPMVFSEDDEKRLIAGRTEKMTKLEIRSVEDIARALSIEKSTVRSHISSILNKLGLESRTQVALYAVELDLGGSDKNI